MNEQDLRAHLADRAGDYYPELRGGRAAVTLRRLAKRTNSTLYEFELAGSGARHAVLVKSPSVPRGPDGRMRTDQTLDRPRLCPKPPLREKSRFEFVALSAIERHITAAQDARFAAIRMLELLPDGSALVMEKADGRTLNWNLLRHLRVAFPQGNRPELAQAFRRAGAWLRTFHQLPDLPQTQPRCETRADFVDAVDRFAEYLAERGVARVSRPFGWRVNEAALTLLPPEMPTGLTHGDYAPRNVLLGPCGRIRVIDTLGRFRAPIYEDLARFVGGLKVSMPQVWSAGFAYDARDLARFEHEFLAGYFGEEAIPLPQIRLFECLTLLERWVALVHRSGEARGWKRMAKGCRQYVWERFLAQHLQSLLNQLEHEREPQVLAATQIP